MSLPTANIDTAVAAGGGYELLKQRLASQGEGLLAQASGLNDARQAEFGRSELKLLARTRARTENNCVARDIVRVGKLLLFGYNVFIGLKKETQVADVFSLYTLNKSNEGVELAEQPLAGGFLADPRFEADFRELYAYYKQASLSQLKVTQDKLFAAFRIGEKHSDVRVFRWAIDREGQASYLDNRGEREMTTPASHDFDWIVTSREQHVNGRHPHVNILDTIFVETIGGDLTVKIENNTESGLGIHSEPVEDKNQSLNDADIAYAQLGSLILLRIRPYRESQDRYLVYNARAQTVTRIDAIGQACVQLPEDHGIIFPGGCYLQSGEVKRFGDDSAGMLFKRMIRSPNGEDVLYVFYEPVAGKRGLFAYNLISKTLQNPIYSHGYARYDNGDILLFQLENEEPTRLHPMQLWATPFCSDEYLASSSQLQTPLGKIGNSELVRCISELIGIARAVLAQAPVRRHYEDLLKSCDRVLNGYFWLDDPIVGGLGALLKQLATLLRQTLDEFDKVESIRQQARKALEQAEQQQRVLLTDIASQRWQSPQQFVEALAQLREQRGKLLTLQEQRYIDSAHLGRLDQRLAEEQDKLAEQTIRFLSGDNAFAPYGKALDDIASRLQSLPSVAALQPLLADLDNTALGLDLLTELLGTLNVGDATLRTRILDAIAGVYSRLNQLRAEARLLRSELGVREATAEFGAQFKLFGQSVANAMEWADTPEKCDEALTRLLTQLEELEGRFGEQEAFLADILSKRETVYEALSARRQTLLEGRQRRGQALATAAERIIAGIAKRTAQLPSAEALHSYFAGDALIGKLRGIGAELRQLGDNVRADDLDAQLKAARDTSLRLLRDKGDLFAGDNTLRLGQHVFTITTQALDLTLLAKDDALYYHLTGTDYLQPALSAELTAGRAYWQQALASETSAVYRAEYLAYTLLCVAESRRQGQSLEALRQACADENLLRQTVQDFAASRYAEGYQKGVHDHDAARILQQLLPMWQEAGLLRFSPASRALALLWWQGQWETSHALWSARGRGAGLLAQQLGQTASQAAVAGDLGQALLQFARDSALSVDEAACQRAGRYLAQELAHGKIAFVASGSALDLLDRLHKYLEQHKLNSEWQNSLAALPLAARWQLACDALAGLIRREDKPEWQPFIAEAAAWALVDFAPTRLNIRLQATIDGLLGEHPLLQNRQLPLNLNDFLERLEQHSTAVVEGFQRYQQARALIIDQEKARLRLGQFQAKPLTSFVRNQLINDVYLPLLGANLAKQIGSAGGASRSDRMGLLLLISPPGYGKTTLMEYIADRLGLIFVRINGPSLGHDVRSLDPAQAGNSAARQELEKLNLGLLMGNNVMLYLDDIQHTHPEFLQKFISLADGTRRIDAVGNGQPQSIDLRGKRFALVMAGNPYTESGEVFKIPDMLANRADIYNLGDVLNGKEAVFAQSYLENCLTSNPTLAPLANRDPADVRRFFRLAAGDALPLTDFAHAYGAAEAQDIVEVLKRLCQVRDVLLKINAAYIASAAQADDYRTEPPFKLQGSYRNMNKLAEKVNALMSAADIANLMHDHYLGEAQTLTAGAEENLLKLAELSGNLSAEQQARWAQIRRDYQHHKRMGGSDADGASKVANQISHIVSALDSLQGQLADQGALERLGLQWRQGMAQLAGALNKQVPPTVNVAAAAVQVAPPAVEIQLPPNQDLAETLRGMAQMFETSYLPVVAAMQHKIRLDHDIWDRVKLIDEQLRRLAEAMHRPAKTADSASKGKPSMTP